MAHGAARRTLAAVAPVMPVQPWRFLFARGLSPSAVYVH